jgi:bifunctional UDP-N-acetylglucosamine pyrophosphorylase/glucosamine-1-phosphate N-acetyltransferase
MTDLEIIILAAGKGTRMGGEKPKVLTDILGRPMLSYVLDAVGKAHDREPLIVIGFQAEKVKEVIGPHKRYVLQAEQRGTGHAVKEALAYLTPGTKHVIVVNGDQPLVSAETISSLYKTHVDKNKSGPLTMSTMKLSDFNDWRSAFYDFGRIVRDRKGTIKKIVERTDTSPAEKLITEVNPAYYCFDADWLCDRIKKINTENPQGEYYLPDLIQIAQDEGTVLNSIEIPAHQALGVNTPEQLKTVLKFL